MKQLIFLLAFLFVLAEAFSCTTFSMKNKNGDVVFGRNFDFPVGMGHINVNFRDMQKTAFVRAPEKPMSWDSKYGSISFNQVGREFPYGGMNEAGLVIEQMWVQEAKYPEADERFGLTEVQWIQYQLDMSGTVQDVIDSNEKVRISFTSAAPLHFLVTDAAGDVATVEILEGELSVHRGKNLPFSVLANCTYEHSLAYKSSKEKKENKTFNGWTENSSGRFVTAVNMIENFNGEDNLVDYAFSVLDSVAQRPGTQWSIVYDITNMEISYKSTENEKVQKIRMSDFDFSCSDSRLFADLSETVEGKSSFRNLSYEENLEMMNRVVNGVEFLKNNIPEGANEASAKYAESVRCR